MHTIDWSLDEGTELEPHNLLGQIMLNDGKNVIEEQCIFVDSWFLVLFMGLKEIMQGKSAQIDIIEEPSPMEFSPIEKGFHLKYKKSIIIIDNLQEFTNDLKISSQRLLWRTKNIPRIEENIILIEIRDLLNTL